MISLPPAPNHSVDATADRQRISAELFRFFSNLIAALLNRVPITGSATFAAGTTVAVTFTNAEPSADYSVWFAPSSNLVLWASSIATTGFTANASSSNSTTVRYMIVRH